MSAPGYEVLKGGSILFHAKGDPPKTLTNYTVDPGNPRLFHPNFPECRFLKYKNQLTKCGRMFGVWWCGAKGTTTCSPECFACEIRQPLEVIET